MRNLLREFISKEKNGVCTYRYDILPRRGRQFTITVKNVNSFGDKKSKKEIRALVIPVLVRHLIKDGSEYSVSSMRIK